LYSLVTVGTLWYLQRSEMDSGSPVLYPAVFVALLVFSFFNVRPKAICFAGDVGSISIGFLLFYYLLNVINERHTYLPLLLLAVYGTDSLLTIVSRIYQRQNIFRAHRSHVYQLLVSQRNWPHLGVAASYAFIQACINGLVLRALDWPATHQFMLAMLILGFLSICYVTTRKRITSPQKEAIL
jgi:UDP-GlcNAc:undecaprenyl-phosphate GlcNAc-1-phosphate transferase